MIKFLGAVEDALGSRSKLDNQFLKFLNRPRHRLFINPTPRFTAVLYMPYRLDPANDLNGDVLIFLNILWGREITKSFFAVDHEGKLYVAESVNEPRKKAPDADLLLNDQLLWKRRNPRNWRLAGRDEKTVRLDVIRRIVSGYNTYRTWEIFKTINTDCPESLLEDVIKLENRRFYAGMQSFRNYQAGNIWSFMRHNRIQKDVRTYNWLLEHNGDVRKRRKQAAKAYPFLASELTGFVSRNEDFKHLSKTVDQAKPLLPALCATFNVRKSTIKNIARLGSLQRSSLFFHVGNIGGVLSALDTIEYKHWPERQKEWMCFDFIISAIPDTWIIQKLEVNQNLYKKRVSQYLRRMSIRGWIAAKAHGDNLAIYSFGLESIEEVISSINRVLPESYQGLEELVNRMSAWNMNTWYEVVERWHRGVLQYETKNATENNLSWSALVSGKEVDGFYFKVLTSPSELENEGREMQHCVSTCVNDCLFSGNHIISQRNKSGDRCGTLEAKTKKFNGESWGIEITQHYGFRNKRPTPREKRAVNKWVAWANSEADFESLVQTRTERHSRRKEVMYELGGINVKRDRFALKYAMSNHGQYLA